MLVSNRDAGWSAAPRSPFGPPERLHRRRLRPSCIAPSAAMKRPIRLALAVVALGALVHYVSPGALVDSMREADLGWIALGVGLYYASQLVGTLNFHQILVARGASVSRIDVLRADLAGYFYALGLPGGPVVGAAVRLLHLARHANVARLLAGVVSNRLLEILAATTAAAIAFPFVVGRLPTPWLWTAIMAVVLVAAALAYAASWNRALGVRCRRLLRRLSLPARLRHRIGASRWQGASVPLSRHLSIGAVSCLRQILGGGGLTAMAYGLGAGFIPDVTFWVRAMLGIVMLLPLTTLGLGLRETALVVLLAPFGVPASTSMALGLVYFAAMLGLALLGAVSEFASGMRPTERRPAPGADESRGVTASPAPRARSSERHR